MQPERHGRVLLVGAGPGAADLLTVRAINALRNADVVLVDALVTIGVRALIPPGTKIIEVGKRGHRPSTPQDFINRLMARLARAGKIVVRLKGGDPSIFGRAAEERAFLQSHGVTVEVIPGVTTASAAAAEFGFSLTTRAGARRVVLATGRTIDGVVDEWGASGDPRATLCLYMGCSDIRAITSQLMSSGLSPLTPALAAIDVSRPGSRLVMSTLGELSNALAAQSIDAPVFICIGEACAEAFDRREMGVSAQATASIRRAR